MALQFLVDDQPAAPAKGLEFLPPDDKTPVTPAPAPTMVILPEYKDELASAQKLRDFQDQEETHLEATSGRMEDRGEDDAPARAFAQASIAAKRNELGLDEKRYQELRGDLDTLSFEAAPSGKLSTGEVVVKPVLAFQPAEWDALVNATDATPEAKKRAIERRAAIRNDVLPEVRQSLNGMEEFQIFEKFHAKDPGIKDDADLVEAFFKRMNSVPGGKALAQVGLGLKQGEAGLSKSIYSLGAAIPGPTQNWMQENADTASGLEESQGAARQTIPGGPWLERLGTVAANIPSLAPSVLGGGVGSVLGETGAIIGSASVAGLQSFGSTRQDALEAYRLQGLDEKEARFKSLGPATLSGLQTGITTALMHGGVEAPFTSKAGQDLLKGTIRQTVMKIGKSYGKGFADEAVEEFTQQFLDGLIAQHTYNPGLTNDQLIAQAFEAGGYGGFMGGMMEGGKTVMDMREERAKALEAAGMKQAATALRSLPEPAVSSPAASPAPAPDASAPAAEASTAAAPAPAPADAASPAATPATNVDPAAETGPATAPVGGELDEVLGTGEQRARSLGNWLGSREGTESSSSQMAPAALLREMLDRAEKSGKSSPEDAMWRKSLEAGHEIPAEMVPQILDDAKSRGVDMSDLSQSTTALRTIDEAHAEGETRQSDEQPPGEAVQGVTKQWEEGLAGVDALGELHKDPLVKILLRTALQNGNASPFLGSLGAIRDVGLVDDHGFLTDKGRDVLAKSYGFPDAAAFEAQAIPRGATPAAEAAPAPAAETAPASTDVAPETPAPTPPATPPAAPVEPAPMPKPAGGDPTSIKNAQVDIERSRRGLPPAMEPARRSFGTVWDEAMARINSDPTWQDGLIAELEKSPRPLSDVEDAALLHRQITLQNEYDSAAGRLNQAFDQGENGDVDRLREQVGFISDELLRLYNIEKAVGTANSRGLNARKMMANEDYSLAAMQTRKRAALGGAPLTPVQEAEIAALHAKIRDLQAQLEKYESGQRDAESDAAADEAVKQLVEQVEAEGAEASAADAQSAADEAPAEEEGTQRHTDGQVYRVPASEIASRPALMQFKRMDESETGVNQEDKLAGQWDDKKAGLLLLWEPSNPAEYGLEDGQRYIVANGHHRLEFGNRQGVQEYNVQIVRQADGVSAEEARGLGAEINIADGKGTIYDQAKFIRNHAATHGEDAAVEAARRIGARGRKAAAIALSATDRLFDAFTNGTVNPDSAAAIAAAAPRNEAAQVAGLRSALLGKSPEFAANRAKAELGRDPNAKREGPVEYDLFGNEVFADIDAQAERATEEQKRLTEEIRAVRGAANKPELAKKHGVDVADPEGVKKRIEELEAERARWENWPNHPDLVAITKQAAGIEGGAPASDSAPSIEKPKPDKTTAKAERKKFVEKALETLSQKADEARQRLRQRAEDAAQGKALFSGGLDPNDIDDYAIIGADFVAKGAKTLGRFAVKMVTEFGDWIKPHLEQLFARSREIHSTTVSPRDLNAEREKIVRSMQARKDEGDTMGDLRGYVRKLALNFVRRGVSDRNALIDAVHAEVRNIDPQLTRRETMDLISGYGDFKGLDPEKAKATLRDLKGQMQQIGKLEDMQAGQPPKKTGVEQREPSDAERKLIKEVNEAKKKGGFEVTDPATQLRTSLDAVKTRLKNQIKDLAERIATGAKPKARAATPSDEETERLTLLRDQLKRTVEGLEEKPGRTDEDRLKAALDATRRSLAEYERRLKEEDFGPRPAGGKEVTSPELENLRARRDAAKQEYHEFRQLDEAVQAQKQAARTQALDDQIAELDRKLREGDLSTGARSAPALTPAQEALVSERDAMRKQLDEMRREATKKPAAEKQVEKLLQSIAELDRRLRTGDLDPKAKGAVTPLSPEAEHLLAMRDAMRREVQNQRELAKPKRSKEEIALQAWKTRALNRIADLHDRLARKDFTSVPKKPLQLDPTALHINFELEEAKKNFNRGLVEDRMSQRPIPMKILGSIGEAINLGRAIMTSIDLSAVLRQGGFITIAHPLRAAAAFPDMFRAMMTEEGKYAVERQIMNRPNAHLYGQAKLALAQEDGSLRSMEEAYMSRWVKKIPKWMGGGLVRGSERAYTTFLNRLRADSFDVMAASLGKSADVTLEEAKAIASFVNIATGRPSLGQNADKAATFLNHIFFAPKYVASRFMLLADPLTGFSISGGTARNRGLVAKEYGRYLIGMAIVYALAKMAGSDDPEWDPRSSDFGKIRFGNTRLDPLSGIAQATTFLGREISLRTKTSSGKLLPLHHGPKDGPKEDQIKYGGSDAFDVATRFLRTKLSPAIGSFWDIRTGKNVVGEPVSTGQAVAKLFVPLSYQDVASAMQDQGLPRGTALAVLAIFGAGVQTYDPTKNPDGTPKAKKK